ncbi:hypothetical protein KQI84_00145 [bacterium]|nr:hypothetical protein [bacterium]
MNKFRFCKSEESQKFFSEIVQMLMKYGEKTEEEAVDLVSRCWKDCDDIDAEGPLIYHEIPYYYAMCILHHPVLGDGNVEWYLDKSYWPPPDPEDFLR